MDPDQPPSKEAGRPGSLLFVPGQAAQSVTCLTADPGVATLILARSHTLVEIDHEIISTAFSSLLLIQEGVLSFTIESVHEVLVNRLVKLAQEKSVVR